MEYQASRHRIIDPMPNEWLVLYAKPVGQLQIHPSQRYSRFRGRISDVSIDQILVTLVGALGIFQNETVALFQYDMEDSMGSSKTDYLGSKFYLYLVDLWLSTQRNYWESAKRTQLGGSATVGNQGPNRWANSK